jgi:hypothetical protein
MPGASEGRPGGRSLPDAENFLAEHTGPVQAAVPERRARRFARARSTAAECSLWAVRHSPSLPEKTSPT